MGMSLEDLSPTLGEHPFVRPKWPEYLQYLENVGVPEGLPLVPAVSEMG